MLYDQLIDYQLLFTGRLIKSICYTAINGFRNNSFYYSLRPTSLQFRPTWSIALSVQTICMNSWHFVLQSIFGIWLGVTFCFFLTIGKTLWGRKVYTFSHDIDTWFFDWKMRNIWFSTRNFLGNFYICWWGLAFGEEECWNLSYSSGQLHIDSLNPFQLGYTGVPLMVNIQLT